MEDKIVHEVLAHRVPELRHELDKMVRKANRFGTDPIAFTMSTPFERKRAYRSFDGTLITVTDRLVEVTVEGVAPRVGNFNLVAAIDFVQGTDATIVRSLPGRQAHPRFRHADSKLCNHCNTRRFRSNVYIVQADESEEQLQIGRSCLKDFLGVDPNRIVSRFTFEKEFGDMMDEERGGRSHPVYYVKEIFAITNAVIRKCGWMSKGAAAQLDPEGLNGIASTSEIVHKLMTPYSPSEKRETQRFIEEDFLGTDYDAADAAINFILNEMPGDSEYVHNLRTITQAGSFHEMRWFGITVSGQAAHHRHLETLKRQELERNSSVDSQWVGEVKKRQEMELTFLSSRTINDFGTLLMKMVDQDGNRFCWFASGNPGFELNQTYKVKATVKAHNEFKGAKETQLTRVSKIG